MNIPFGARTQMAAVFLVFLFHFLQSADAQVSSPSSIAISGPGNVYTGDALYLAITVNEAQGTAYSVESVRIGVQDLTHEMECRRPLKPLGLSVFLTCPKDSSGKYTATVPDEATLGVQVSGVTAGSHTLTIRMKVNGVLRTESRPLVVRSRPAAPPASPAIAGTPVPGLLKWETSMLALGAQWCPGPSGLTFMDPSQVWNYDGARAFFQLADYTGNKGWEACAFNIARQYNDYLVARNGNVPGWAVFPHGLRMAYERSGDASFKQSVLQMSRNAGSAEWRLGADDQIREIAYQVNAHVEAERLGAPRHPDLSRAINYLLGYFDSVFVQSSYTIHQTVADALAAEALIYYYELTKDSRVPPAIKTMLDWTWDFAWDKSAYRLVFNPDPAGPKCQDGCRLYTGEWINLTAPVFAWYWNITSNSLYQARGDELFEHALDENISGSGKIFSQNYRWSFEYVRWRRTTRGDGTCVYSVTPAAPSIGAVGGTVAIQVSTSAACPWAASSSVAWAEIASGANRAGSGTVNVAVAPNSAATARTAILSVADRAVPLTQAALDTSCQSGMDSGGSCAWSSAVVVAGTPQSTAVGTPFGSALQVKVLDSAANPVAAAAVTFTSPGAGPSAGFNGNTTATALTNAQGIATSPVPRANGVAGSYTVTAMVAGLAPLSFNLTNTPPDPITVTVLPKSVVLGPSGRREFSATVTGTSNTAVTWTLTPQVGTLTGSTYTAPPEFSAEQTVTLTARSQADPNVAGSATIRLKRDLTIFAPTAAPASCTASGSGTELGVKFRSDVDGQIRGIRFYKTVIDLSAHTGTLWTAAGVKLATGAFTNESPSGWQQMLFASPVSISANTTYIASYYTGGWYCSSGFAFLNAGVDNPPLHALKDGVDGGNGIYSPSPAGGVAPAQSFVSSNFWVDVLFIESTPVEPESLTIAGGSPQSTPTGTAFSAALRVKVLDTLSRPMSGVTVTFSGPDSGAGATFGGSTTVAAITGSDGIAISPVPVANSMTGSYTVAGTVAGLTPVHFALNNASPPPPVSITASGGTPQSASVGTSFGAALQARVLDEFSNPVPGATVTFTAPASGASARFNGNVTSTATTNAAGIATSPIPVANSTSGSYNVTAVVTGLSPASFNLTNTAAPPIVVTVSPAAKTLGPGEQQAFTATVTGTANTAVTWTLSSGVGTMNGNTYTAPGTIASVQTVTVTATSQANSSAKGTATITLRPADVTIFSSASAPVSCTGMGAGTELGVKFRSDISGQVRGIRFYKTASDVSTHTGTLWSAAGTKLATGTFTNESDAGWQQMLFASPVAIEANKTYVASYYSGSWYCATAFGFASAGVDNPPLHALRDGVDGPNGVFIASPGGGVMPVQGLAGSNFWVDVLFSAAPPAQPGSIATVSGTPQSTVAGTSFGAALQARVLDTASNPMAGVTVTFTAPSSGAGASFNGSATATAVTNGSGVAASPVPVANATTGTYNVSAAVTGLTPAQFALTNTAPPPPASIAVAAGSPQSTAAGTSFGAALQARVLDASSNPVAGATVTFTAPASGARATFGGSATATAVTNASGIATSPVPLANSTAGTYNVAASVTGVTPVQFVLTNTAVPASIAATGGTPQSANTGAVFGAALQARVLDSSSNPIAGVTVTFTAPASGASATFGGATTATAVTNASGVATSPVPTANTAAGTYNVAAAVTGLTPAQFALTNIAVPSSVAATGGTPQSATAGTSFASALQARVLDASSNPIAGVTVTFTAPASGATARFNGNATATAVTNASGIAASPIPVAGATTGSYNVTAAVTGLTPAQFALSNTPAPASIAASGGTPQSATAGTQFGAALQARVLDASSNPVAGVTVTFTAPASGASATFSGNAIASAVTNASGIATSPVPTANATVGSYSVTASVTGLSPASFSLANTALSVTVVVAPATAILRPSEQQAFTATVTGTGNTSVTWSLSPNVGAMSGNTYTAPSTISSVQTITLTATSQASAAAKGSATITLQPADVTMFSNSPPSNAACSGTGSGIELGVKFRSDVAGYIRGVRFFKSANDSTTHTGSLWSAAGVRLATGSFTNETASGWQQMVFAVPVAIQANATYVASYFTTGWYCSSTFGFWSAGVDNPPLHALRDGVEGPNGVYVSSPNGGVMPDQSLAASNFWVDVLFTTAPPAQPASIAAAAGTPQSAAAGASFAAALQARVLDSASNPIAGVTVTFTAPSSGPSAAFNGSAVATAVTNASGIATSPVPRANGSTGTYNVTASISGLTPAQFALTNTAPPPPASIAAFAGTPQSAATGTAFNSALQARVLDASSNPVPGVTVTFTAPSSGASATFGGNIVATAVTNASGIAASPVPAANATLGSYSVTASVAGLSPASFQLTNAIAPPVTVTVSPQTVTLRASEQQTFTATVTGSADTAVTWTLSPQVGTMSGNTYTAPSTISAAGTVTLTAASRANTSVTATATITLRPPDATIFSADSAPTSCSQRGTGTELGVKFRSDVNGYIRGIRFYKAASDSTSHTGTLWSAAGVALATGPFANETASGWQEMLFATPVAIQANTTYIASYHTGGWYCSSAFAFLSAGVDNPPLHALKDGTDGPNGVFVNSASPGAVPNQSFVSSNFWVDVLFSTAP